MKSILLSLLIIFSSYLFAGKPVDVSKPLSEINGIPELEIITKVLDFDTVDLGTKKVMEIEVRSRGYSTVSIYGFLISQEYDNFIMSDTATDFKPIQVRGDNSTFEVTFTPTAPIDYYSELYIQCDAYGVVPIKLIAVGNWDPYAHASNFPQTEELNLNILPIGNNVSFSLNSAVGLKAGKLEIYSTDGRIIRSIDLANNTSNVNLNINKNELPPLSIIRLTQGEKVYTYKFMKE